MSDKTITFEFIDRILSSYNTEYMHMKELAQKDLGQELIDKIHKFLEERQKLPEAIEIKKIVFDDPSKVSDRDINSIVDAFIRVRSGGSADEIETKSIDDILILFNKWIVLDKNRSSIDDIALIATPESAEEAAVEEAFIELGKTVSPSASYSAFPAASPSPLEASAYAPSSSQEVGDFVVGSTPDITSTYTRQSGALYKVL